MAVEIGREMTARELADAAGKSLLGCSVWVPPWPEYQGGRGVVIEIAPDPGAPEIAFIVRHDDGQQMGVFEYEDVVLLIHGAGGDNEGSC